MDQLLLLMEEKKLFLIEGLSGFKIARLLKTNKRSLDKILNDSLGMNVEKIISMYRIQYAHEMLKKGINYTELWKLAGFKSRSKMERALEDIVV